MRKNSRVKTGCYYIPYHCQNDPCQREIIAMFSSPQNSVALGLLVLYFGNGYT